MSRSLFRLAVVLAVLGGVLALLIVGNAPRPRAVPEPEPAPVALAQPPEVAPEPHTPRWNPSGPALPGLPADAEALKWEPAAPSLPKPAIAGISDDGRFLATVRSQGRWGEEPNGLYIWDLETGQRRRIPAKDPGNWGWLLVGFSPDNKSFAVRFGGHLSVWEIGADRPKAELNTDDWREARRQPVLAPDGSAVALGGSDLLVLDAGKPRPFGAPAVAKGFQYSTPAWSPDGRWLAAVTESTSHLCVWDADSGEVAWKSPELPYGYGTAVAFTPDSRRVIAVNWRVGAVSEWDVATRKKVREAKVLATGGQQNGAIAADGSRFVWLETPRDQAAREAVVIADADGKELRRITPPASVHTSRISGNGKRLAVSAHDGSLRVYDTESGTLVRTISDGWSPALHVAYRDGDKVIRSAHADGTIREQDAETQKPLRLTRLDLPKDEHLVTVSPDGRLWATVTAEGTARVWDTATGRPRLDCEKRVPIPHRRIHYGRFGPPPGAPYTEPDYRATALSFAAGGRYLIGSTDTGKAITIWDVASGKTLHTVDTLDKPACVALSPDGRTLFACCDANASEGEGMVLYPQMVRAWDVASGRPVWETRINPLPAPEPHPNFSVAIRSLQVIRDGNALAVVVTEYTSWEGSARLGPIQTHRVRVIPRRSSEAPQSFLIHEPHAVAFSADSRWMASGNTRVCDLETGKRYGPVHVPQPGYEPSGAVSAAFHPNGKWVALAGPEWAGQYDADAFRAYAEQKRLELIPLGYDPSDRD